MIPIWRGNNSPPDTARYLMFSKSTTGYLFSVHVKFHKDISTGLKVMEENVNFLEKLSELIRIFPLV